MGILELTDGTEGWGTLAPGGEDVSILIPMAKSILLVLDDIHEQSTMFSPLVDVASAFTSSYIREYQKLLLSKSF